MVERLELLAEKHRVENAKAELEQTEKRLIAEAKRRSVADRISAGDDFVQAAEDVEREFDETTFLSAQERDDLERWRLAIAQQNENLQAVKKALAELDAKQADKKRFALLAAKRSMENIRAELQRAEARLIEEAKKQRVEDRIFEEVLEEDETVEDPEAEYHEIDWRDFEVPGEFDDEATFIWGKERDDLESWRLAMRLQDENLEVIKKALADLDAKEGTDWVAEVRKMMERRKRWPELICDSGGGLWMQGIRHEEEKLSAVQQELDQIDEQSQKQAASRIAPQVQPRWNEPATVAPAMPKPTRKGRRLNRTTGTRSGRRRRVQPRPQTRMPGTVTNPSAARKMEAYLEAKGIGLTDFATSVGTTDRTLRSFRRTGKVRRNIFDSIAQQMGTTKEELLKD